MVHWLSIEVECSACKQRRTIVLGTKTREEKPIAKCPECKSDQIRITSVTPKEGVK